MELSYVRNDTGIKSHGWLQSGKIISVSPRIVMVVQCVFFPSLLQVKQVESTCFTCTSIGFAKWYVACEKAPWLFTSIYMTHISNDWNQGHHQEFVVLTNSSLLGCGREMENVGKEGRGEIETDRGYEEG